jgi:hypothetical protein
MSDQFAADHDLRGARAVMRELITGYRVSQITRVACCGTSCMTGTTRNASGSSGTAAMRCVSTAVLETDSPLCVVEATAIER